MYVIAVSNEKGGVAKTTTTLSLGAALAETGRRVLLIDLDAQANLTLALGLEPSQMQPTIADVLLENTPLQGVIRATGYDNLDLIPSKDQTCMIERFLPIRMKYEYTLRQALMHSLIGHNIVLLDCPPSIGVATLNAFVAADLLLIPTQAEFFSIYGLKNLMRWIRRVRKDFNPRLTYRLLLTMFDRRNRAHRILSEQLRLSFDSGVLDTVIETDTKLRESPIAGMPILYHAPKSRSANQYRSLALEINAYVKETTLQPAR